jgi:decaprenylphospho-beta-D-erythro-pentofuranosid-2-ulose 2-reductase
MGRAIAQKLVERGDSVYLMGIDESDLAKSASDLQARSKQNKESGYHLCNLEEPATFAQALDAAEVYLGTFDTVIVTAALFASQDALENDIELTRRLVTVNYANTLVFCEHVRKRLLERGGGSLVVFSSVAGDRGRKPVAIYGSSKAGISAYLEALDHKFHEKGLHVLCVKPGFVKTGMTAGLKPPPFAGEPDQVASDVIAALDAKKPMLYTPGMWALVMLVIRNLPRFIMRKIGF